MDEGLGYGRGGDKPARRYRAERLAAAAVSGGERFELRLRPLYPWRL
jgi:hypothetical protein